MVIWAWLGALLVGLTLGLLGSGGSILTVPVLVYLVGEPDKLAIAESLAIVAFISLVGAIPFARRHLIDWRSVFLFGVPGMFGAYGGAWISQFVTGSFQLMLFSLIMLVAAYAMLRRRQPGPSIARHAAWKIAAEGMAVGVITGLVGVGGGFLIVPALVLLGGLPMHTAVGTSLAIIAIKSASGFYKYVDVLADLDLGVNWGVVVLFSVIGAAASLAGMALGRHIRHDLLQRSFAVFLVAMGVFIFWQNVGLLTT